MFFQDWHWTGIKKEFVKYFVKHPCSLHVKTEGDTAIIGIRREPFVDSSAWSETQLLLYLSTSEVEDLIERLQKINKSEKEK